MTTPRSSAPVVGATADEPEPRVAPVRRAPVPPPKSAPRPVARRRTLMTSPATTTSPTSLRRKLGREVVETVRRAGYRFRG